MGITARSYKFNRYLFVYLSIIPVLLYLVIMGIGPIFYSIYLSLYNWGLLSANKPFVGFGNYIKALNDEVFWAALKNTLYFVGARTFIGIPLSLLLALSVFRLGSTLRSSFVTIYFLPAVTSMVAVGLVFKFLYYPQAGLFNYLLSLVGIPRQMFLKSIDQALPSITAMLIWRGIGFQAVIYLAALDGVPKYLYDSAEIDGVNWFQRLFHITLPLLKQASVFVFIITILWAFQMFQPIFVMTSPVGGPMHSTQVLVLYIVQNAFEYFRMGYACAISMFLLVIVLIVTLIQLRLGKAKWEY